MVIKVRGRWLRFLAVLALGFVAGATWSGMRLGARVDRITLDNAILLDEVERLARTLESRERALTERTRSPVHSVEVEIEGLTQEHVRLHVEQQAHELLRHLVGHDVGSVNPPLIERALERTVTVDREDYTLTPTLIVIGERVYVRILVRPGKAE